MTMENQYCSVIDKLGSTPSKSLNYWQKQNKTRPLSVWYDYIYFLFSMLLESVALLLSVLSDASGSEPHCLFKPTSVNGNTRKVFGIPKMLLRTHIHKKIVMALLFLQTPIPSEKRQMQDCWEEALL